MFFIDLNNTTHYSKCKMYADGTSLCVLGRDATEIKPMINDDLNQLNDWFIANKLNLNTVKSDLMMIASMQPLTNPNLRTVVQIGDSQLKRVSSSKYLGIEIDDRLSWCNHVEKICKKISSGIVMIQRVRPYINIDTLQIIGAMSL